MIFEKECFESLDKRALICYNNIVKSLAKPETTCNSIFEKYGGIQPWEELF